MALVNQPGERLKVIALLAAISVLLGYFGIRVVPRLSRGNQPAGSTSGGSVTAEAQLAADMQPPVASAPTATIAPGLSLDALTKDSRPASRAGARASTPVGIPPPARNPFAPPPGAGSDQAPALSTPPAARPRRPLPTQGSDRFLAGGGGGRMMAMHRTPKSMLPPILMTSPIGLPADQTDGPAALKGIVQGRPPVAVFSVGGRVVTVEKHDALPNGYVVAEISSSGVVLRRGDEWSSQDVGGSLLPLRESEPLRTRTARAHVAVGGRRRFGRSEFPHGPGYSGVDADGVPVLAALRTAAARPTGPGPAMTGTKLCVPGMSRAGSLGPRN